MSSEESAAVAPTVEETASALEGASLSSVDPPSTDAVASPAENAPPPENAPSSAPADGAAPSAEAAEASQADADTWRSWGMGKLKSVASKSAAVVEKSETVSGAVSRASGLAGTASGLAGTTFRSVSTAVSVSAAFTKAAAKDYVKVAREDGAKALAGHVAGQAKDAIGSGAELASSAASATKQVVKEKAGAVAERATAAGGRAAEVTTAVRSKVGETATAVGEKVGAVRETVGEKYGAVRETVGEKVGAVRETVGEKYGAVRETVGETASAVKSKVGEKVVVVRERAAAVGGAVAERSGAAIDAGRSAAGAAASKAGAAVGKAGVVAAEVGHRVAEKLPGMGPQMPTTQLVRIGQILEQNGGAAVLGRLEAASVRASALRKEAHAALGDGAQAQAEGDAVYLHEIFSKASLTHESHTTAHFPHAHVTAPSAHTCPIPLSPCITSLVSLNVTRRISSFAHVACPAFSISSRPNHCFLNVYQKNKTGPRRADGG